MSQLADLRREFEAISDRARAVAARVGEERVDTRPCPDAWSVAECLRHLTMTANAYRPVWRKAMAEARHAGLTGHEPFALDVWGRAFCWFLEPPPKVRFSSPRAFRPECPRPPRRALSEFLDSQAGILQAIDQAEGLPLDRVKTTSAFGRWIRYGLWSSFCANAAHHRRHLWQAERVAGALLEAPHTKTDR